MKCEELAERLTDFLEGELEESEQAAALEHLSSCGSCEAVLAGTRDVMQLAQDHGRVELSDDDRSRMLSTLLGSVDDSAAT